MNNVTLMGRLTKDPELRRTSSGTAVASFTLAVDKIINGERQADFIDCAAWQKTAEFLSKYFSKGQMLALSGRIQTRSYEDKNGNKRKAVEVIANQLYFCGGKSDAKADYESTGHEPVIEDYDEGDLPF